MTRILPSVALLTEKIVTFRNFAGQYAFMLWQTRHKEFSLGKRIQLR